MKGARLSVRRCESQHCVLSSMGSRVYRSGSHPRNHKISWLSLLCLSLVLYINQPRLQCIQSQHLMKSMMVLGSPDLLKRAFLEPYMMTHIFHSNSKSGKSPVVVTNKTYQGSSPIPYEWRERSYWNRDSIILMFIFLKNMFYEKSYGLLKRWAPTSLNSIFTESSNRFHGSTSFNGRKR